MSTLPCLTPEIESKLKNYPKEDVFDGCVAAAHVAYAATDGAFLFPITPSSPAAEIYEAWSAGQRVNAFGDVNVVKQLQSEAGAASAVHGAVSAGAMATTFTASQGLLLMIPPMFRIAGELLPCVIHVAARAVAGQALSIFGDHTDIMSVRSTGWAILGGSSVQEAQDLACIAHMATLEAQVPFVHFFDGFRTSHELQKIKVLDYLTVRELMNADQISRFRRRALNPTHPVTRGTAQGPEVYFQNVETANEYYLGCADAVERCMKRFAEVVGREYKLFDYHGPTDATDVIVVMGSAAPIVQEAVDWLVANAPERKCGVLAVRLFRPWKLERFMESLPASCRRIAVLDRVKEAGALGEPLFLDVAASLQTHGRNIEVIGGRYGLGSRDFTPAMALSVFDHLADPTSKPRMGFTIGIVDDITKTSIDYSKWVKTDCVPAGTSQCMFWGMGSDGTVGANKNVIKILGMNTPLQVQGYFAYSAHKAGGLTVSHLRFGPKKITSSYLLQACDYIAVHRSSYVDRYDCFANIKVGGTAVINTDWTDAEVIEKMPARVKKLLADNQVKLYVIDADRVAAENGMGRRINNVLMTSFFKVSGVLPFEQAISLFKEAIKKTYGKKGMHIVEANWKCVDAAVDNTRQIHYPVDEWKNAECIQAAAGCTVPPSHKFPEPPSFVTDVMVKLARGEDLPVSSFLPFKGGIIPPGSTEFEKRGIALNVPIVDMDKCTQCNQCSFVCPHAAIRPFLMDDEEAEKSPENFAARKCKNPASLASYKYRIQVSPLDCTGCELCFIACPDDALTMVPMESVRQVEGTNWTFAQTLKDKCDDVEPENRLTLKGSQFYPPLMEFSGACEGCGETPYVKLLTQLFGERLVIANATGCSSIWGASYPANAYTVNQKGQGPAWANSLFEDNAEFGFGMAMATAHRREALRDNIEKLLSNEEAAAAIDPLVRDELARWLLHWTDAGVCQRTYAALKDRLDGERSKHPMVQAVADNCDLLPRISQWIIGGDGWAYDIGYGGLDHVVASGVDVNILVMDTEVYSNTGGQTSKSTPIGAVHKFAAGGKKANKKDLGAICIEYGNVYVASISSSANMTQTVRAFVEAESYPGPSLILAYSPCIEHQYLKPFNLQQEHCKLAVNAGFWPLYRYDPRKAENDEAAFQLDSKKIKADVIDLVRRENRFAMLKRANPTLAADLEKRLKEWIDSRFKRLVHRTYGLGAPAKDDSVDPTKLYNILYGTDTGTAEAVANRISATLASRGLVGKVAGMDEVTLEDMQGMAQIIIVCATAGQGEYPPNAKALAAELEKAVQNNQSNMLENTKFAVMGLGDTAYVFFNQAAKRFDEYLARLGARRIVDMGLGDDQAEDGFDTAFTEWLPEFLLEIKAPEPILNTDEPLPSAYEAVTVAPGEVKDVVHDGFQRIKIVENRRVTPADYEVDVRHLEFDLGDTGIKYALGDSLAIMPRNLPERVTAFCEYFGFDADQWVEIRPTTKVHPKKYQAAFAHPMSVRQLFTEVLDPFSKPPRNFYENLYRYASDAEEKNVLKSLMDKEHRDQLRGWTKDYLTSFDVMRRFPSVKPTLAQMIDLIPILKARYYSIASSQKAVGANRLQLCVGIVEMLNSTGERKPGLMTGHLARTEIGAFLNGTIKATCFNLPPTDKHPIIVAGMGTGLAPFRSFYQYRAMLHSQGKEVGPFSIYFGCRYKAKDYLYQDEMEKLLKDGVVTELEVAFSRDQKEKDYIQHHIVRNSANFYQRMVTEDGYFYLCGSAKQVPIDVRAAVRAVLCAEGNMTEQEAEDTIVQWQLKGKYNVEAW